MRRCKELAAIFVVLIIMVAVVFSAARQPYSPSGPAEGVGQGAVLLSSQVPWNILDSTTDSGTEPTALAVTERTYLTVLAAVIAASSGDEEISVVHIPPSWNGIRFRCRSTTEGDDSDYQIYVGTLGGGTDCELVDLGELAFVTGTQASITSGSEMADECVITTSNCWEKAWSVANPSGDKVATASIDLLGADLVVIVGTTIDHNAELIGQGY